MEIIGMNKDQIYEAKFNKNGKWQDIVLTFIIYQFNMTNLYIHEMYFFLSSHGG